VSNPAWNPSGAAAAESRFTPLRVLSVVVVLLVLFIILAPQPTSDTGAAFSSYAAGAGGTRALYETLGRLGFAVGRNEKPLASALDSSAVYVLIQPAQPLTAVEENQLISAVRKGAVLAFTAGDDSFADSLGFKNGTPPNDYYTLGQTTVAGGNPPEDSVADIRSAFQTVFPISATVASVTDTDNQTYLWIDPKRDKNTATDSSQLASLVLGHRVGRGYAVIIAPAAILVNQLIRNPRPAIAIVRALEFADTSLPSHSRARRIIFDEYHHGSGSHADVVAAVERALTTTAVGRTVIQLIAAALVLLLAFAVRPLAPVSDPPISRRSPLEHVGALAYAYTQVNARSLGADRLVRGLRRRHPLGLPRSLPNSYYLSVLRDRLPTASTDVDRITAALAANSTDASNHFATTGEAVANIEEAFRE
jgi:hypothetical protein